MAESRSHEIPTSRRRPLPEQPPDDTSLRPERQRADRNRNWGFYAAEAGKLAYCTLAEYQAPTSERAALKRRVEAYCETFDVRFDRCEGATFFGTVGTGKDHLAAAIGRRAVYLGYQVSWVHAGLWFARLWDARQSGRTIEAIDELVKPEVLVLSEVARPYEPLTPLQAESLLSALDCRVRAGRLTIATLNAANEDAAADRIGRPLWDRLVDNAQTFACIWESFRTPAPQDAA